MLKAITVLHFLVSLQSQFDLLPLLMVHVDCLPGVYLRGALALRLVVTPTAFN